jgi:hypothetical protein
VPALPSDLSLSQCLLRLALDQSYFVNFISVQREGERITSEGRECVEAGEVLNKSVGSNEENIRALFTRIRSVTACMIILFDEFEALVSPGEESIISSVHPSICRCSQM